MKPLTIKTAAVPLVLAAALAAGCTTMGTGYGNSASGRNPVNFNWSSRDDVSGTMNATMPDGKTYSGQFFQITTDTTVDTLGPLWSGWGPGWRRGGWGYWNAGPDFVKHYTGKVVANLQTPDGTYMRCTFHLVHPSSGMSGGGQGNCQTPEGGDINATFPKA